MAGLQRPHAKTARSIGSDLVSAMAAALVRNKTFLNGLEQARGPLTFEGTVTAVNRTSGGVNQVQVKRTGKPSADPTWYTVYAAMHVPIVGDQYRLLQIGRGAVIVIAVMNGGRPNEHTIAYPGGAEKRYDSGRGLAEKLDDTHHGQRYRTAAHGGVVAQQFDEAGHVRHIGDHVRNADALTDTGTVTGKRIRRTVNGGTGFDEAYQDVNDGKGERRTRYHGLTEHGYAHDDGTGTGTQIVTIKLSRQGSGGAVQHKQHGSSAYHFAGDDGTGRYYINHATGGRAIDHNGSVARIFCSSDGTNPLLQVSSSGAGNGGQVQAKQYNSSSYHVSGDDGAGKWFVAHASGKKVTDHDGTTQTVYSGNVGVIWFYGNAAGNPGQMQAKQYNTASVHLFGDDGAGNAFKQSASATAYIKVSGGASAHAHTKDGHTHPNGAQEQALSTDSSEIRMLSASAQGAVKRGSHASTAGFNNAAGAPFTINATSPNNFCNFTPTPSWGPASGSDPHLKVVTASVYKNGTSNIGSYYISGTMPGVNSNYGVPVDGATSTYYASLANKYDGTISLYGFNTASTATAVAVAVWTQIVA